MPHLGLSESCRAFNLYDTLKKIIMNNLSADSIDSVELYPTRHSK
ncbi:hypothetical protein EMIT0162MI3_10978 [Pseudomonas chlororaphis]